MTDRRKRGIRLTRHLLLTILIEKCRKRLYPAPDLSFQRLYRCDLSSSKRANWKLLFDRGAVFSKRQTRWHSTLKFKPVTRDFPICLSEASIHVLVYHQRLDISDSEAARVLNPRKCIYLQAVRIVGNEK